ASLESTLGAPVRFTSLESLRGENLAIVHGVATDRRVPFAVRVELSWNTTFTTLVADAGAPRGGDAATTALDASLDAAPARAPVCRTPLYCDAPELAADPICLYDDGPFIWGVTRAGRAIAGTRVDASGAYRCD